MAVGMGLHHSRHITVNNGNTTPMDIEGNRISFRAHCFVYFSCQQSQSEFLEKESFGGSTSAAVARRCNPEHQQCQDTVDHPGSLHRAPFSCIILHLPLFPFSCTPACASCYKSHRRLLEPSGGSLETR
ncbi:unnamed protein product [Prorocentrum cordatum]|uniref:Uncharacterized protein n=1 Tax=Prorocentrum cordatum TaxID=2364126 RepID=A0ABN9U7R4_9DINO|nr:unnamed protein product [Polarella glacialis]